MKAKNNFESNNLEDGANDLVCLSHYNKCSTPHKGCYDNSLSNSNEVKIASSKPLTVHTFEKDIKLHSSIGFLSIINCVIIDFFF